MKVTFIGGGNIGTLMAIYTIDKGYDVCIYSSKPSLWVNNLKLYDENEVLLNEVSGFEVTNNLENALKDVNIIIITYPSFLFDKLSKEIEPFIEEGMCICIIPGCGAEFYLNNLVSKGATLFGLQRVPAVARVKEYGKSVYILGGKRDMLNIASFPITNCEFIKSFFESTFEIPCKVLPNYLNVTLTPSNPILHTSRLYSLFKNYDSNKLYSDNILFYESWDNESSDILIKCDEELQILCKNIKLDLSHVKSLKDHYESYSIEEMTNKISSIVGFKGILSPMIKKENGWDIDFLSRYFSADFPYGLKIIIDIGKLYNVSVENMEIVWNWYLEVTQSKKYFNIFEFGINSKEDFEEFYFKI